MSTSVFNCEICHEIPRTPIILSCCQSLGCRECLKKISFPNDSCVERLIFNCPSCFKLNDESMCGTESKLLSRAISELRGETTTSTIGEGLSLFEKSCSRCEIPLEKEQNPYVFCATCNSGLFCESCSKILHSSGRFRNHLLVSHKPGLLSHRSRSYQNSSVTDYFLDAPKCKVHDQLLESICLRDYTFLCSQCVATHKAGCKSSLIKIR